MICTTYFENSLCLSWNFLFDQLSQMIIHCLQLGKFIFQKFLFVFSFLSITASDEVMPIAPTTYEVYWNVRGLVLTSQSEEHYSEGEDQSSDHHQQEDTIITTTTIVLYIICMHFHSLYVVTPDNCIAIKPSTRKHRRMWIPR